MDPIHEGAHDPHPIPGHDRRHYSAGRAFGVVEHPAGVHNHSHVAADGSLHIQPHDTKTDGIIFYGFIFGMLAMQYGVAHWRRVSPKTFRLASLGGLWLFPVISAVGARSLRFCALWLVYSLAVFYYLRLSREKPLQPRTPKSVYRFFDIAYRVASQTAGAAYFVTVFLSFLPPVALALPAFVMEYLVVGMLYGTYFSVLTRDMTELAAETIATNLGYSKKGDDDASKPVPRGLCALCGEDLQPVGGEESGSGAEDVHAVLARLDRASRLRPEAAAADPGARKPTVRVPLGNGSCVFRLECGHIFHDECIKGWCIVGKKHVCPCCVERVDLRAIAGDNFLARSSLMFAQVLDAVRYFVVWLPLLVLALRFLFYEAGVSLTGPAEIIINATSLAPAGGGEAAGAVDQPLQLGSGEGADAAATGGAPPA